MAAMNKHVTAIDYDSRRAAPGSVFVAVRGARADGAAFAPQAVPGARGGRGREPPPPGLDGRGWSSPTRGWRWPCWPPRSQATRARHCAPSASRAPTARRRRRTCCARSSRPPACAAGCIGTVDYRIGGEERDAVAHDARGVRRPAAAARDGRRRVRAPARWRCRRTRSRCIGSTACGSRPRSSRTSRAIISTSTATWRTTSPPSAGCSRCSPRGRAGASINVDDPYGASPRADLRPPGHLRARPPGRRDARRAASLALDGLAFDVRDAARRGARRVAAARAAQRLQHPRRRRRRPSRSTCRSTAIERGIARAAAACPAASRCVSAARRRHHASSSTTRTPTTR